MCRLISVRFVGKFMEIRRFQSHHLNAVGKLYLESRLATFTWLDTVDLTYQILTGIQRAKVFGWQLNQTKLSVLSQFGHLNASFTIYLLVLVSYVVVLD